MKKEIYFAGGCFWGVEKYLGLINGVVETEVGYANGNGDNPSYEDVCKKNTGHAETVRLVYDTEKTSLEKVAALYLDAIDPTALNRQGNDKGSQYRTGIYYTDSNDEAVLRPLLSELQKEYSQPVVVELMPLENYWRAEDYHQKYLDKNPGGYCHLGDTIFEHARNAQ